VYSRYGSGGAWPIVAALLVAGFIGGMASTFVLSVVFSLNPSAGLVPASSTPAGLSNSIGLVAIMVGVVVSGGVALPPLLRAIAGLSISPGSGILTILVGRMVSRAISMFIGGGLAGGVAVFPLLGVLGLASTVVAMAIEVSMITSVADSHRDERWFDRDDLSDRTGRI
jgi:hypothetical protein